MQTLALAFSPRFIALTVCGALAALPASVGALESLTTLNLTLCRILEVGV